MRLVDRFVNGPRDESRLRNGHGKSNNSAAYPSASGRTTNGLDVEKGERPVVTDADEDKP